jgi:hypothetical protein
VHAPTDSIPKVDKPVPPVPVPAPQPADLPLAHGPLLTLGPITVLQISEVLIRKFLKSGVFKSGQPFFVIGPPGENGVSDGYLVRLRDEKNWS